MDDNQKKFSKQKSRTTIALTVWGVSLLIFVSYLNEPGIGFFGIFFFLVTIYAFFNFIEYRQLKKRLG